MWTVEIYPDPGFKEKLIDDLNAHEKDGPYGIYWYVDVDEKDKRKIEKKIRKTHARQRWYRKEWGRSSNYREIFFKNNKPPYRCRYCNRELKRSELQVDHMVPVAETKKNPGARSLLYIKGIKNVNDPKNLVASCQRCNMKKGSKMGLWYIRGMLGGHKSYWVFLGVIRALLVIFVIYLVLRFTGNSFWT